MKLWIFKHIYSKIINKYSHDNIVQIAQHGALPRLQGGKTMSQNQPQEEIQETTENEQDGRSRINIHAILLGFIVVIVGFSAYKLYQWNKGVPSDYDPDYQTTDFDVEALDMIIPLASNKLEGHEDDGLTTILCLGDDPFSLDQGEGGLAEQIAAKTNATVYNGSFTGTTIALRNPTFEDWYSIDAFSFYNVAKSISSGDFEFMRNVIDYGYDETYLRSAEMLAALDMDTVDMICIMYDGRDYINKRTCENPNDPYDPITYTGALRSGIEAIQDAYPHIRIIVMSHSFCHNVNEENTYESGDRVDLGNGTLSHYLQKELDVCMDCSVSFIDNFYGSVNEDNYQDYMTDYIHFNDAGRELLADRFVQCIFPDLADTQ